MYEYLTHFTKSIKNQTCRMYMELYGHDVKHSLVAGSSTNKGLQKPFLAMNRADNWRIKFCIKTCFGQMFVECENFAWRSKFE